MPTIIQIIAASGQTIYVFIWNSIGQIWNTNTLAFENYNVLNYAKYAIASVEQSQSGSYFANIPTGITVLGEYTFAGYTQTGATPTPQPVDIPIEQGNFILSQPSVIIPASLSDLITTLRTLGKDLPTSKVIRNPSEQLGGADMPEFPVDGINTTFQLKSIPLSDYFGAPLYIWITIIGTGGVVRTQQGFSVVDPINGIINFTTAPNPGNATQTAGVYASYNYQWFTDAEIAQFLYQAAQSTLAGTTDPTTIVNGLQPAMIQYALYEFWKSVASKWAEKYAATGGDTSEQAQTPAQTYLKLAQDAYAKAVNLQTLYYQRQGQRNAPASATISHNWDPISPIR